MKLEETECWRKKQMVDTNKKIVLSVDFCFKQ